MTKADDDLLDEIKENFKRCEEWEAEARTNYVRDTKFGNGDSYNKWQWDADIAASRDFDKKPMLTVNKTAQHCLQIINDARQNKAGIQIRPVGGDATQAAASLYEALIRHIEYKSNATLAYEAATYTTVFGGWGYVRVHVDYADEDSFDQDIFIKRVGDPLTIYLDPDIQEYDGSDARFGFVFEDLPRKEAEAKYKKHLDALEGPSVDGGDMWNGKDHVRVCEYFYRTEKPDTLIALPDGQTVRKSAFPGGAYDEMKAMPGVIVKERPIVDQTVEWCKVIGSKIVDRKPWMGKYIPIARMIGQETVVDGKMDRKGHVRALLDPQRMYNYHSSGSVEFVALQTKTPWLASARAIDGNTAQWAEANVKTAAVLVWNDVTDDGEPVQQPQRIAPPPAASGHIEGMQIAQQELMMASGQYQAIMGAPSNETSGKAINARQRQGENATYHFIDHQALMVRFLGRVILDLIPKVYDTRRIIQAIGRDDKRVRVEVNPSLAGQGGQPEAAQQLADPEADDFDSETVSAILNPNVGKYDVVADVGPSYGTQRQEAFNAFSQILAQNKEMFQVVGDLWAESADFPGSEKLSKRLHRMVPQTALGGPTAEIQQMQQKFQEMAQSGQSEIAQLHEALQAANAKLANQQADLDRKDFEAQTTRTAALAKIDPEAFKPVIREMVSQMLGQPIIPLMHQHAMAERGMLPQEPVAPAPPAPAPPPDMGMMGQPQPVPGMMAPQEPGMVQ